MLAFATIIYSAGINPHSVSWLVGFYVSVILFLLALRSAGKSIIHRSYALYLSMLSLYLVAVYFLHVMVPGSNPEITKKTVALWTRFLCIGGVFMPVTLYHFTLRFAGVRWRQLNLIEMIGWFLACGFYALSLAGRYIDDYIWSGVTWVPSMGRTYRYFFYMTSFYVSLGVLVPLVCIFRKGDYSRRLQLTYYLFGAIPLWVSCWGHFLISLGINIYPAGGTIFLLHAAIMAYAVFQKRVFDFSLVLRRALIYAAVSASLGMLYGVVVAMLILLSNFSSIGERGQTVIFIVVAGFFFAPLHSYCQRLIDQIFYRAQRNEQLILKKFASETASTIDMRQIAGALCHCIDAGLQLSSVHLYLTDEKGGRALFAYQENGSLHFSHWPASQSLPKEIPIHMTGPTIFQKTTLLTPESTDRAVLVTERNDRMVVPLKQGEQLVGVLLLGPKRADEQYTEEDLIFAETVANYSAVALENGRSYLQLRQFQELTTQILNGLTTGVMLFDRSGNIVSVNEAAKLFFPKIDCFPTTVKGLGQIQPVLAGILKKTLIETSSITNMELTLQASRQLSALLSIRSLSHNDSSLFLLILHDISDYKEMEERSRNREHLAELGETIASINHEIRNVLQPIRFQVETLKEIKFENSDFNRCMGILPNRLAALDRLLNDLRDLARPLDLRKMTVDVNAVLASVVREVKCLPNATRIEFTITVAESAINCYADGHWLRLVLFNLLRNAADATANNAAPAVCVGVQGNERHTVIKISDNGCGIPEHSMQKLFKPFYSTKGHAGNGLGLVISRKVIELHGGNITVESKTNIGTHFTLCIPQMSAAAESPAG